MASPTITSPALTEMGMILGTAAYMSPEQAKGRQADKRSDVWAFGAVLYEMLTGQRAFKGDDVSDTLAAVLRQDIDWTALPASTPASVRRLIGAVPRSRRQAAAARHRRSADRAGRSRRARQGDAGDVPALAPQPRSALATRDSSRALRDRGRCIGRNRCVVPQALDRRCAGHSIPDSHCRKDRLSQRCSTVT